MDPPDHTRLRMLVAKAFTVRRVEELRPRVRKLAGRLVGDLIASGPPVDLVENFALPLPVAVICELLGVPVSDRPRFRVWSDSALSTSSLTAEQSQANLEELRDYMRGLIEARRATPADDLMTALIEARDVRDRLTELELVDMCIAILVAGHETTASQIPNFVHVLLERPEQWAQLRETPDLIPAAVEELLRFVPLGAGSNFPPLRQGGRRGRRRAGARGRACAGRGRGGQSRRAPVRFARGAQVRPRRNQHLGFGHGSHHCLGAPLARLELQEALGALLARLPNLSVAGDIVWKTQMLIRGPRTMPVAW